MTPPPHSPLTVDTADGAMPAQLWLPPKRSGPGLVLVQEIFGVSDYIQQRAAHLAQLGYVVLVPEVYWRLDDADLDESAPDVMQQAMALAGRADWETAVSDVRAAFRALRNRSDVTGKAGLIGFCYGGGLAFNVAALEQPDVLVSYYGSALPGLLGLADQVTAPSLHHFGTADAFISADQRREIEETVTARPGVRFVSYADANHAFDNFTSDMFYHREASEEAWKNTVSFLAAELPV